MVVIGIRRHAELARMKALEPQLAHQTRHTLAADLKPLVDELIPKKTDLSPFSQSDLNKVALQLNQRPRKTLGFASPAERFSECVALTG